MKHMKQLLTTFCALSIVSCGPLITEPKPDIPETVEYDTVKIEYTTEQEMPLTNALVGDVSWTAVLTGSVVATTNLLMLYPFVLLNEIKKHPPTESGEGFWIWQHEDAEGAFRLEIFDNGPSELAGSNAHSFKIFGGETKEQFLEIISGDYTIAEGRFLGAQRGFGVLHFNFDNIRAIDKDEEEVYGQMYIAYRVLGGVKQVTVVTDEVRKLDDPDDGTALYRYVQFRDSNGQFRFATKTDFAKDGEPLETMAIHSSWIGPEGRSLSRISDGSIEINELLLEECWERARITFADITPDLPGLNYEDGESSACNTELLEVELTPPPLVAVPERLTEPPSRHPDEESDVIVDP